MSAARRAALAALALGISVRLPAAAQAPDPFYGELERDGLAALARGEGGEAARLLRIACFGQLELPERLGGCLVRLGLAQEAAGDGDGFGQTFRRLQTVEERFAVWPRLALEAEERAAFAKIAARRVPPALLRAVPAFAGWAPAPAEPKRAEKSAKAPAKPEPKEKPKEEPKRVAGKEPESSPAPRPRIEEAPVASPAGPPAPAPAVTSPPAPAEWTVAERDAVERARPLLATPAGIDAIDGALAEVQPVAARHPDDADTQRVVAVLAYRASRWEVCATAFRRAGLPPADQPLVRFYMAVCLWETGDRTGAADAVRDVAPQLARTDFVTRYLRAILGPAAVSP